MKKVVIFCFFIFLLSFCSEKGKPIIKIKYEEPYNYFIFSKDFENDNLPQTKTENVYSIKKDSITAYIKNNNLNLNFKGKYIKEEVKNKLKILIKLKNIIIDKLYPSLTFSVPENDEFLIIYPLPSDVIKELQTYGPSFEAKYTILAVIYDSNSVYDFANFSMFNIIPKNHLEILMASTSFVGSTANITARLNVANKSPEGKSLKLTLKYNNNVMDEITTKTDALGVAIFKVKMEQKGLWDIKVSEVESQDFPLKISASMMVTEKARILLTTDKPVYQPGQSIYVRALSLRMPDLIPKQGQKVIFTLINPDGAIVEKIEKETDEFGISSVSFELGKNVVHGNYQIKTFVGDSYMEKTVKVFEYTLPRFNITPVFYKNYYTPGETVSGSITAQYFFQKPLASAKFKIELYGIDIDDYIKTNNETKILEYEGSFDEYGKATFEFKLPDFIKTPDKPVYFRSEFIVWDVTEHKEVQSVIFPVVKEELVIYFIPEGGKIVSDFLNKFYIFTTDPLGKGVETDLEIEFYCSGELEEKVETISKTEEIGMYLMTHNPKSCIFGKYVIKGKSKDNKLSASKFFDFYIKGKSIDAYVFLWFSKYIYDVGDEINLNIYGYSPSGIVYIDLINEGQLIYSDVAFLEKGVAKKNVGVDVTMKGNIIIDAIVLDSNGAMAYDRKSIFVRDGRSVKIQIQTDKEKYAPGENAKIIFDVKDIQNKPAVSALGVQIVDTAVYSVTENKPGLIEYYYKVDEEFKNVCIDSYAPPMICNPYEIFTSGEIKEGSEEKNQQKAGAFFSYFIKKEALPFVHTSSKQINQYVSSFVSSITYKEKTRIVEELKILVENTGYNWEQLKDFCLKAYFYDPWWNLYTVTEDYDILSFHSKGIEPIMKISFSIQKYMIYEYEWKEVYDDIIPTMDMPMEMFFKEDSSVIDEEIKENGKTKPKAEISKIRKEFPETLYFNPSIITDSNGKASFDLTMADSITTWRLTAIGNTKNGEIGSSEKSILVFQDFFIDIDFPPFLTMGDKIKFPVFVYNYLDQKQEVDVVVEQGEFFTFLGNKKESVLLEPKEVKSVYFPVKITKGGTFDIVVKGFGDKMSDGIQKSVEVKPDGKKIEKSNIFVINKESFSYSVSSPDNTIENSEKLILKLMPVLWINAIDGIEALLKEPYGCFQQSSSIIWPNALIVKLLKDSNKLTPELLMKAEYLTDKGYQRILTFQSPEGGFGWYQGDEPRITLTAFGLMELYDIKQIRVVDENVINKAVDWAYSKQNSDGSFTPDDSFFSSYSFGGDIGLTAFYAWSLKRLGKTGANYNKSIDYIVSKYMTQKENLSLYQLALIANALIEDGNNKDIINEIIYKFKNTFKVKENMVYWVMEGPDNNYWYAESGDIELTSLILESLYKAGEIELFVNGLFYLLSKKNFNGGFGSYFATVLAIMQFINSAPMMSDFDEVKLKIYLNDKLIDTYVINNSNKNVFHYVDMSGLINSPGKNLIAVNKEGKENVLIQILQSYYIPWYEMARRGSFSPVTIKTEYKKEEDIDDIYKLIVEIENISQNEKPMLMAVLGIPPGFSVVEDSAEKLLKEHVIKNYEIDIEKNRLNLYLPDFSSGNKIVFTILYHLKYPVSVITPDVYVYPYYRPGDRGEEIPYKVNAGF